MDSNLIKIWSENFAEKRKLDEEFFSYIFRIIKNDINKDGNKWLDIGCGDGRILIPLAIKFFHTYFYGIDINKIMIKGLNKILRKSGIKNVTTKLQSADNFLKNCPKYNVISFFQSIHFFNLRMILNKVCRRLQRNGYIIIATTTHKQFKSIPYSKNKFIYATEIKRTPDWNSIVQKLKIKKVKLIARRDFTVFKPFNNSSELKNFLLALPYSAFTCLDDMIRSVVIEEIIKKFKSKKNFKFMLDKFRIGIFKLYE